MLSNESPEEANHQHMQVLNLTPELTSFPLFPNLPLEIRRMIWQMAMTYERNINIQLFKSYDLGVFPRNRQRTSAEDGSPYSPAPGRYTATVFDGAGMSALFHTTSESRQEAEEFYRVRLHNVSFKRTKTTVKGTLYLCPELDTITLNSIMGGLKGLDDIGIPADLTMESAIQMIDGCPGRRQALKECIERLERIMFVRVVSWYPSSIRCSTSPGGEVNRSVPIAGKSGMVDRLETDPRPILNDLRKVYLGPTDPRIAVRAWSYLLMKLGVSKDNLNRSSSFKLCYGETRLLHSLVRARTAKTNRKIAKEWLEELAYLRKRRSVFGIVEEPSEPPQLAVGFWLFPLESIGPLYEETERNGKHDSGNLTPVESEFDRVEDMTKYPPKLYSYYLFTN
ncbi:hypothetical protein BKA59DRAFT_454390 [Fusarium tricinctum]|uniref:2EXR domain-containing protein n=1 Tax=Fusarium tricinctum TaxID=61284 RepID=A0A8K0RT99_9HYPO|nr:hypothetical protein BKA59DRAFT_454390 [Fusarium tricinctum]